MIGALNPFSPWGFANCAFTTGGTELAAHPHDELIDHVLKAAGDFDADGMLVFDDGGITGHPDHQAATNAALAVADALDLPVLAWTIPAHVASELNDEFGTAFVGREKADCDVVIEVDRAAQLEAIDCHASQSRVNPVMRRRLELQQRYEWLRFLRSRSATHS